MKLSLPTSTKGWRPVWGRQVKQTELFFLWPSLCEIGRLTGDSLYLLISTLPYKHACNKHTYIQYLPYSITPTTIHCKTYCISLTCFKYWYLFAITFGFGVWGFGGDILCRLVFYTVRPCPWMHHFLVINLVCNKIHYSTITTTSSTVFHKHVQCVPYFLNHLQCK